MFLAVRSLCVLFLCAFVPPRDAIHSFESLAALHDALKIFTNAQKSPTIATSLYAMRFICCISHFFCEPCDELRKRQPLLRPHCPRELPPFILLLRLLCVSAALRDAIHFCIPLRALRLRVMLLLIFNRHHQIIAGNSPPKINRRKKSKITRNGG